MSKKCAIYSRISTVDKNQTTENQRRELTALADHRGWTVVKEYEDAVSGSKGRDQRPGLDAMLTDAGRGRFDVCMVWAVDRLGRSLTDLVGFLQHLHSVSVDLVVLQQDIDTTTPTGKLMFHLTAAFAEWERSIIQARVKAGLARVKADQAAGKARYDSAGNRKKRIGKQPLNPKRAAYVREMLAQGRGNSETARLTGVSLSSVNRIKSGAIA